MIRSSLILLSGGRGERFGSSIPKQYQTFHGAPLILHSLKTFVKIPQIKEIIVVCHSEYQDIFQDYPVIFAYPGERRQDSVFSGLKKVSNPWTLVHDGARPFVYAEEVAELFAAAQQSNAATLASPLPYAIKQRASLQTLDRDSLAIIHTPQCIKTEILKTGLLKAQEQNITLTDDTAAAEILGVTAKLVFNKYPQIKVSYPEDLTIAHALA
ncbi:2-C-methyl-D-erythritol 4-phosphate cytidylyltransferase [Chlamydia sp. 17-3921]|uniref:2-C-methyl-D-erythritol 4-phosphate cytidylyltransferase n=1 Tax=Chlamydia sp. 17-3921 TaxID=2675798 RepID=UPI001917E126|nr:2-C-methyl-D-erythritol 4-phosphate cytidylyltransferase [Chlamydia sp. 17-3921]